MARRDGHSLSEYQALRAMMEAGTATAAARRLGLSQSAISRAIGSLETRTGRTLFERDSGRLRPTAEAVRLNRRLDPLFAALDRIDAPAEPVRETLRLIAPPTYAHRFLVSFVTGFLKANPHFFVSLEVNTSDEVVRGLLDDRFDLGVIGVELSRAGLRMIPYRTSSAVCAMARGHPLAEKATVAPTDLDGEALIALTHRHARRAQLDKLLSQAGARAHVVAEVSTSFAAIDLAKEGLGLAVVNPFPVIHFRSEDMEFRRFDAPMTYRSYFAVSDQRPLPRIARAFIRHVRLHTPADPFSQKA
ncbi:DNA-binding transcriptional LysR family regulator [Rhodovulum iodosum]|uniref:DNA-binding transcriptional LysR family regulator n=1 Tax=Rhodovulum iodosum TaxID=68291 RepID=A0ABV3XQ59_9RHOB|nr:LysR family transcriptional regulator [Rhodovulum robiginosum]RSK31375.1 LysR family transcriptional regulator [Rhodovulum robiginosum]